MLHTHLAYIEQVLSSRPWFAGDELSAADIMMSFPIEVASARIPGGSSYEAILAWLNRIHERPAYQRALEKGGSYRYAN
ncbi:MAG: glutathione S-transferase family protein [Rhizobiaceae bacterium]|nr:glutathione S-transferase family protein [Rhizobiaceae bacterium]